MGAAKQCLAEFLGTFYLCFVGIAAILTTQPPINSGLGLLGVALAHGLAVSIAVSVFGGISGAHINPAVTVAMLVTRRISLPLSIAYILSQLVSATVAALLCRYMFAETAVESAKLGIPLPGAADTSILLVLVTEAILTFMLVVSVFGTAVDERGAQVNLGGFAIGLTVTICILAGGPLTGASMNPARSFGPALALWHFDWHWCYWVAPLVAGVAAGLLYQHVLLPEHPQPRKPPPEGMRP